VGEEITSNVRLTDRIGIGVLTRLVDRDLVDEVLAETGRTEQRTRSLPARVVVYYVLGLCLFFGESYEEVMRLLVEGLQFARTWRKEWTIPTTGAICQARRAAARPFRTHSRAVRAAGHAGGLAAVAPADGRRRVRAGYRGHT
jgi:Insertion element 4 transposase N-terminal